MKRIKHVSFTSFVISGGCLALAFYLVDLWFVSIAIMVCRLFFWIGGYVRIKWSPTLFFIFDFVFLIVGIFMAVPPILLVAGLVGSLITWDLEGYHHRLENIAFYGREIEHARKHLKRVFIAGSCGGGLAILSLIIHTNPGFVLIVLLSIASVLGLVIGIQMAQRSI